MFKLLKHSTKKTKILIILCLVCVLFQAILAVVQPVFLMLITNMLLVPVAADFVWGQFWLYVGLMLAAAFLTLLFGIFGSYFGSKSSLLLAQTIRHNMFAKTQSLAFADIDKISTSSLITRLTNDVQKFQMTLQLIITLMVQAPLLLIGGLVIGFIMSPIMGAIMVGIMVVLVGVILLIAWRGIPLFSKVQSNIDETNKTMRENILGMRVVKAFCIEQEQQKRFDVSNESLRKNNTKAQTIFSMLMPAIMLLFNVSVCVVMIVGATTDALLDTSGMASMAAASAIFGLVQILFLVMSAVIMALMVIINWSRTRPSVVRIQYIFDIEPSIKNASHAKKLEKNLDIEFKNVSFKYALDAQEFVLKNINCTFKHGQNIGIVGGTGSGKSSLIGLIPRLYDYSEGEVLIGKIPVKEIDLDNLREKVGICLQENILFSGTIKSNLMYGDQKADLNDLKDAADIACARDFIESEVLQYDSVVEQRGRNFSGGQRQRLSIARTLVKKPEILILDDSTSALDMATEAKLQKNLKEKREGTTTITVAQRISAVKDCDLIIVMDKGEIVGQGDHDYLKKHNDIYRSIVVSQLGKEGLR